MERRLEVGEATGSRTVAPGENGHAIRFLPAGEQFHTRSCARCAGLLVNEWCYDLDNTGGYTVEVLRCVQCGHRVDPVILRNRIRLAVANKPVRRMQPTHSMSLELLDQAA